MVHMQHAFFPSSAVKDCFHFQHPNNGSNDRCADLDFEIEALEEISSFAV